MVLDPDDWLPSHAEHVRVRNQNEAQRGIEWSPIFSPVVRRKLGSIYDDHIGQREFSAVEQDLDEACLDIMRRHSRVELSVEYLKDAITDDFVEAEELADWLASLPLAIDIVRRRWESIEGAEDHTPAILTAPQEFYSAVNDVLLEERVDWLYLHDRFRRRESQPLHLSVIRPMEALLSDDPRFDGAERAYGEATNLLAQGSYGAACTATYAAVQETFRGLGVAGADLGAMFSNARDKGFLIGADEKLVSIVKGLGGWMTANRSARGNAHGASAATKEDAELAIHVAAALMLRLMRFGPGADAGRGVPSDDTPASTSET